MATSKPHPEDLTQLPSYVPPNGNGNGVTTIVVDPWDDDVAIDFDDDEIEDDGVQVDDEMLQLQARTEQLAAAVQQREAARIQPKVTAGALGAAIAGGIPAILSAVDALNLPPELQPLVLAVAAVLGSLCGGYVKPARTPAV